jgi:DNA-binding transcriptional ArsR family regulator
MDDDIQLYKRDLSVLSSSTRLKILKTISNKSMVPSDIAIEIGKSQPTVIEHLNTLIANSYVIKLSTKNKKYTFYTLSEKGKDVVSSQKRIRLILYSAILLVILGGVFSIFSYTTSMSTFAAASSTTSQPYNSGPAYFFLYLAILLAGVAGICLYLLMARKLYNKL